MILLHTLYAYTIGRESLAADRPASIRRSELRVENGDSQNLALTITAWLDKQLANLLNKAVEAAEWKRQLNVYVQVSENTITQSHVVPVTSKCQYLLPVTSIRIARYINTSIRIARFNNTTIRSARHINTPICIARYINTFCALKIRSNEICTTWRLCCLFLQSTFLIVIPTCVQ